MKCYEVTGMVSAEKRLSALDELSLITLRSSEGEGLVAADLLGVRPGDRVVVSTSGAQAVLGTNLPVAGFSPLLTPHRTGGSDRNRAG